MVFQSPYFLNQTSRRIYHLVRLTMCSGQAQSEPTEHLLCTKSVKVIALIVSRSNCRVRGLAHWSAAWPRFPSRCTVIHNWYPGLNIDNFSYGFQSTAVLQVRRLTVTDTEWKPLMSVFFLLDDLGRAVSVDLGPSSARQKTGTAHLGNQLDGGAIICSTVISAYLLCVHNCH